VVTSVNEFPAATRERWHELVLGVLRKSGASGGVDDLATVTQDGIRVLPLYTREDAPATTGAPDGRAVGQAWDVRQRHTEQAGVLADLENGVTSLWIAAGPDELSTVLDGVYLDLAGVVLDGGVHFEAVADAYLGLLSDRGVRPGQARGNLGADPLSVQARTGQRPDLGAAVELAARCAPDRGALRAIVADGLPYHEAGGSDAQELACALAAGAEYLRALTAAGLTVEEATAQLEFRYAATADQFATIAKLRAARRLWSRVTEVAGAVARQRQHAVTSPVTQTRRDPWVNMLRTTVACFAAGVGGADAVTVLPFDSAIGLPDAFALRIARNTQTVLLEEAHVARVADPAGGSWYLEALTTELAHRAWEGFRRIEAAGGLSAALADGSVADDLAATWERRRDDLAHRRQPLTGVSEFPDLRERAVTRRPAPAPAGGGLPRVRLADDFESLRDRADALPVRPVVFLATRGPQARHAARAAFAANLFQAGGFDTVTAGATTDAAALVAAYREAGSPPLVCLCATDEEYELDAAHATSTLRAAGARVVLIAGRPAGGNTHPYGHAGAAPTTTRMRDAYDTDGAIFAGCDAVAVLTALHGELDREGADDGR
jgi:methylmalonyl-CoA mutase